MRLNAILNSKNPENVLIEFLRILEQESREIDNILDGELKTELQSYFQRNYLFPLNSLPEKRRVRYLRGYSRGEMNYIVSEILRSNGKINILDAGCGWGTHAILFSLLGARVVGVDINKVRLEVAKRRLEYYSQFLERKLNVEFRNQNIFSINEVNNFDLIWAIEAISHIDPVPEFLKLSFCLLKSGGKIIISDHNGLNLAEQIKLFKERGCSLHTFVEDPLTKAKIPYAVERIFSLPKIQKLLTRVGFKIVYKECFIGFRSRASDNVYRNVISKLNRFPVFSDTLGRIYVIAGQKLN